VCRALKAQAPDFGSHRLDAPRKALGGQEVGYVFHKQALRSRRRADGVVTFV